MKLSRCLALTTIGWSICTAAHAAPLQATSEGAHIGLDLLATDFLNLAVVIVFVIFFVRTATSLLKARFLRRMACDGVPSRP